MEINTDLYTVKHIDLVLSLLDVPKLNTAIEVCNDVVKYNPDLDLNDDMFFQECASLIISEKGL